MGLIAGGNPLFVLGEIYLLIMVLRAVFSWFPLSPGSPLAPVNRVLHLLTEPVLRPFRRVIPPIGMFDMSYLVAFIVVLLIVDQVFARL